MGGVVRGVPVAAVSGGVRGTGLELQYAVGLAQSPADWRR